MLLAKFSFITACTQFPCPRGSVCKVCNDTREAYCEYTCADDNGGCDEGSQCIEVDVPTCSPGQCCSPVNITCQGMLMMMDSVMNMPTYGVPFVSKLKEIASL